MPCVTWPMLVTRLLVSTGPSGPRKLGKSLIQASGVCPRPGTLTYSSAQAIPGLDIAAPKGGDSWATTLQLLKAVLRGPGYPVVGGCRHLAALSLCTTCSNSPASSLLQCTDRKRCHPAREPGSMCSLCTQGEPWPLPTTRSSSSLLASASPAAALAHVPEVPPRLAVGGLLGMKDPGLDQSDTWFPTIPTGEDWRAGEEDAGQFWDPTLYCQSGPRSLP